jgi:hypothetical protein
MNRTHHERDTTSIVPGTSTPERLDIRRSGQPENKEVAALQMAHHNPSDSSSMTMNADPKFRRKGVRGGDSLSLRAGEAPSRRLFLVIGPSRQDRARSPVRRFAVAAALKRKTG